MNLTPDRLNFYLVDKPRPVCYNVFMSFHRENVIWKSADGSWYIGFFAAFVTGDDPEWDVDYDHSRFQWASGPHATEDKARGSWRGANPGMHHIIKNPGEETDEYDKMFQYYLNKTDDKITFTVVL